MFIGHASVLQCGFSAAFACDKAALNRRTSKRSGIVWD
jgi:hypothetical protein